MTEQPDVMGDYLRRGWRIDDEGRWHPPSAEQVVDAIEALIDAKTKNGNVYMAKTNLLRVLVSDEGRELSMTEEGQ